MTQVILFLLGVATALVVCWVVALAISCWVDRERDS